MKKQNFIDWIQDEINEIKWHDNYEISEEYKTFTYVKKRVESGVFDEKKESARERFLDSKFYRLGIKPRIYHFTENVHPFGAITIAVDTPLTWKKVRGIVDKNLITLNDLIASNPDMHSRATYMLAGLREWNIHGVAVCIEQDNYSKKYGRMKAKGKLYQWLIKGKRRI